MKVKKTEELFQIEGNQRCDNYSTVVKLVQILLLKGHYLDNRQNLNGVQELDVSMIISWFFFIVLQSYRRMEYILKYLEWRGRHQQFAFKWLIFLYHSCNFSVKVKKKRTKNKTAIPLWWWWCREYIKIAWKGHPPIIVHTVPALIPFNLIFLLMWIYFKKLILIR